MSEIVPTKKKTYAGYKKKTARESKRQEALLLLRERFITANLAYDSPLPLADLIDEMEAEGIDFGTSKNTFLAVATRVSDEFNWHGVWRVGRNRFIQYGDRGFEDAIAKVRKAHLTAEGMATSIVNKQLAAFSVIQDELLSILIGRIPTMENAQALKLLQIIGNMSAKVLEKGKGLEGGHGEVENETANLLRELSNALGGKTREVMTKALEQAALGISPVIDVRTIDDESAERAALFAKQDEEHKKRR